MTEKWATFMPRERNKGDEENDHYRATWQGLYRLLNDAIIESTIDMERAYEIREVAVDGSAGQLLVVVVAGDL